MADFSGDIAVTGKINKLINSVQLFLVVTKVFPDRR